MSGGFDAALDGGHLLGAAAALGSAASWALGSVLFKRLGDALAPVALTAAKGAVGAAMLALAMPAFALRPVAPGVLEPLVLSGLLGIAAGTPCFSWP